jgi:hypothetical protein
MPDLLVKSKSTPEENGSVVKVTPESAGWDYVGFEVFRLEEGKTVERQSGEEEVCLVLLSGLCNGSTEGEEWRNIGGRESVFDGVPCALYLPPGTAYRVEAVTGLELAVTSSPAEQGAAAQLILPEDIEVEVRGSGNMEREIRPILMEDRLAQRPLVELPPAQARPRRPAARDLPGRDLLPPVSAGRGVRLPAGVHRGPFPGRDADLPRRGRRASPAGVPRGLRAPGLRPLLPERHGRSRPGVEDQERPGSRVAAGMRA